MIKTRIAPTPSGLLHRGNAFNFLLTSSLVRQKGGELRLRIDDLDAPRVRPEYIEDIFETLAWLGINWQSGPIDAADHVTNYQQTFRIRRYAELLDQLAAGGYVFACTCSRKDIIEASEDGQYPGTCRFKNLPLATPDAAWRLLTPQNTICSFLDALMGNVSITLYSDARDFIIRRRDGLPAYHIASLADDVDFGINTIVRGKDLLLSTAVQLYLADCLDLPLFKDVSFYHHPLIKDIAGGKLSKSAGSESLKAMRNSGKSKDDFLEEFTKWKQAILINKIQL